MLASRQWNRKYTPDKGDLLQLFYLPALQDAKRYDRLTGYFNASAMMLAARGIEKLVHNNGRMRLVVGCTLEQAEIAAIEKGEQLGEQVAKNLTKLPLSPPDTESFNALELLAWMIAKKYLKVKVAVPCDANKKPIPADGIFHEKSGIIEDRNGNKIAWNGSLNETASGWKHNWESINVYTSWGVEPERVDDEETNFVQIWNNKSQHVVVFDVPEAVLKNLMQFMPDSDMPARLKKPLSSPISTADGNSIDSPIDLRSQVWSFIQKSPSLCNGGERVGEATSAITPWPHQIKAFERLRAQWPPKLLIADEVGLGKTIQTGLFLRQAWLSGRIKRVLILAPKAVVQQWQIELREKFNLSWPIYDGKKLIWYSSPAWRGQNERTVDRQSWHEEPIVITSSHLMRRHDRANSLLKNAKPWDLIILDEAHHARRHAAGTQQRRGPNTLLALMQRLRRRTQGLILLTATPMQVNPIEVWDLLNLLGLPAVWTADAFLKFFDDLEHPNPSSDAMERMAKMFRAAEEFYGQVPLDDVQNGTGLSAPETNRLLRALRASASIPRRKLDISEKQIAIKIMRGHTPIRWLVSRHTRELLRRYYKAGVLSTSIADRRVEDHFLDMTDDERQIYDAVEKYITSTYRRANTKERNAVGFVMTIYRRRLASSFKALRETLYRRLNAMSEGNKLSLTGFDEDIPDDEIVDDALDVDDITELERKALEAEEKKVIQDLLTRIAKVPTDSKANSLRTILQKLWEDGHQQTMVFTQYTDTMDFLRNELQKRSSLRVMCFSGRGGEISSSGGNWRDIDRDDAKRRFRNGEADVLLCTDAASEGLNFQFCGALINYDMPWNPMRVEQRIGRIDRVGQKNRIIRIINLHYEGTVETDVYRALKKRIHLFESVVGRLQPILSQLPQVITKTVLTGGDQNSAERANVVDEIEQQVIEANKRGFDIDAVAEGDLTIPDRPPSPITMVDLDRVISSPQLMPPGFDVQRMAQHEYSLLAPGMDNPVRVTTDPEYYEAHAESVEFWSPGNILFRQPDMLPDFEDFPVSASLADFLDQYSNTK